MRGAGLSGWALRHHGLPGPACKPQRCVRGTDDARPHRELIGSRQVSSFAPMDIGTMLEPVLAVQAAAPSTEPGSESTMNRRSLFRSAAATGLLGIAATTAHAATKTGADSAPLLTGPQGPMPPLPLLTDHGEMRGEMLYRKLGWTGETVSAIGFVVRISRSLGSTRQLRSAYARQHSIAV